MYSCMRNAYRTIHSHSYVPSVTQQALVFTNLRIDGTIGNTRFHLFAEIKAKLDKLSIIFSTIDFDPRINGNEITRLLQIVIIVNETFVFCYKKLIMEKFAFKKYQFD